MHKVQADSTRAANTVASFFRQITKCMHSVHFCTQTTKLLDRLNPAGENTSKLVQRVPLSCFLFLKRNIQNGTRIKGHPLSVFRHYVIFLKKDPLSFFFDILQQIG